MSALLITRCLSFGTRFTLGFCGNLTTDELNSFKRNYYIYELYSCYIVLKKIILLKKNMSVSKSIHYIKVGISRIFFFTWKVFIVNYLLFLRRPFFFTVINSYMASFHLCLHKNVAHDSFYLAKLMSCMLPSICAFLSVSDVSIDLHVIK